MPRVPIIGTNTGRIAAAPQQSPLQKLAMFQRAGDSFQPLIDQAIDSAIEAKGDRLAFEAAKTDAKNKKELSSLFSEFSGSMTDLSIASDLEPFEGRTERFEEASQDIIDEITKGASNDFVGESFSLRASALRSAARVTVARFENRRFVSAVRVDLENRAESAAREFDSAQNDVHKELIREQFVESAQPSGAVDEKFSDKIIDKFDREVSKAAARRLLGNDPDALIALLEDPESLVGLGLEERIRLSDAAYKKAQDEVDAADKRADEAIGDLQDDNLKEATAMVINGADLEDVKKFVLDNAQNFSVSGLTTARTMLNTNQAVRDDPTVLTTVEDLIDEDDSGAREALNDAFHSRLLTTGARNRLKDILDDRVGSGLSPRRNGEKLIKGGLAPSSGMFATGNERIKSQLLISAALEQFDLFIKEENPDGQAILEMSRSILKDISGRDVSGIKFKPYGITISGPRITSADIDASISAIAKAQMSGLLSADLVLFHMENLSNQSVEIKAFEASERSK